RPQILTSENIAKLTLEGFGEKAQKFAEMLQSRNAALLKYGFQIRKDDLSENLVHDSVQAVLDRVANQVPESLRSTSAVIHGVDESWEICLLKFTVEMIQHSAGRNIQDFRRKGLL
ncbi:MAG: hypothetical protein JO066_05145, partial [Verrucomicrobia bacterium]|nr:hypothetical protein [Verrucomicrobiota bacterium]